VFEKYQLPVELQLYLENIPCARKMRFKLLKELVRVEEVGFDPTNYDPIDDLRT
jgi:hypothetical protein